MKGTGMKKSRREKMEVIFATPISGSTVSPPEGWSGQGYLSTKKDLLLARNTEAKAPANMFREFEFEEPGLYMITGEIYGNCSAYMIEANDYDETVSEGPFSIEVLLAGGEALWFRCRLIDNSNDARSFVAIKGFKVSKL